MRQLLNFKSGLKNNDSTLHSPGARDVYGMSIRCKCAAEPGKRFRYGSNHLMVFGEFLKRKLAASKPDEGVHPKDFVAYLEARVLDPIGCTYTRWLRDDLGNPGLPYGAYMTGREWAKFGLLVRDRGKHGDQELIPTEHFDEMFSGSKANPNYGLNFWLVGKRSRRELIPKDIVSASGMFNQRLYISESEVQPRHRAARQDRRAEALQRPRLPDAAVRRLGLATRRQQASLSLGPLGEVALHLELADRVLRGHVAQDPVDVPLGRPGPVIATEHPGDAAV